MPGDREQRVVEKYDNGDVFEGAEGGENGVEHVLERLDPRDGSEGPQDSEGPEGVQARTLLVIRNDTGDHDDKIELVPTVLQVAVFGENEPE